MPPRLMRNQPEGSWLGLTVLESPGVSSVEAKSKMLRMLICEGESWHVR